MSNSEIKDHNWLTTSLLILTIIYPGWLYNNGAYSTLAYLPTLTLLLVASSLFSPLFSLKPNWSSVKQRTTSALKDPILWAFFLFFVYILIQHANSGAVRIHQGESLTFKPLSNPHLPFSFDQSYARKAIIWVFSGFAILLSIRHGLTEKKSFVFLTLAILINAVFLATLGLAQYASHTPKMFWTFDVNNDVFFSTFGYENNGGSFFILMSAVALGGILFSLFNLKKYKFISFTFFFALFTLFIISVFPTFTRFCYLEAIALSAILVIIIAFTLLKKLSSKRLISILAILIFFTGSTSHEKRTNSKILHDFKNITHLNGDLVKREFSVRTWQWEYTIAIWKDYPFFGTGYDNMRYLQGWYARKNKNHLDMLRSAGKANTHNDALQSLSEFGIVGLTLLLIPILLMLSKIVVQKSWKNGLVFGGLVGISLNVAHSLVDLPYRNGLILFTTLAFIACASRDSKLLTTAAPSEPRKRFKTLSIIALFLIFSFSIYTLFAPMVHNKLMNKYSSYSNNQSEEKLRLINLVDAIWFSSADVKLKKAELLFSKWEKEGNANDLNSAALASHFAYFTDINRVESALLFSRIMEKLGYLWEAEIAIKILVDRNPKDESLKNKLYLFNLRHGKALPLKKKFMLIQ